MPSMVNSRSHPCHPSVDSKLGEELAVPTLSGRSPMPHRPLSTSPASKTPTRAPRNAAPVPLPTVPSMRQSPTDYAPPSLRAYVITTDPGDRQTSPFAAPCRTATARRRRRRLCRAERRVFHTKPHRPYARIKAVEHRQETTKRSPPPAMPLAARSHVATVACPSRSVSPSSL